MTEKRFWYDFEDCTGAKIVDFKEDKEYSLETIGDFRAIEELLNMLHEENKKLDEKYICEFSLRETLQQELQRVENENEQLKTQLQNTSDQRDEFYRGARENANRVGKLEKENEQLKQENTVLNDKIEFLETIFKETDEELFIATKKITEQMTLENKR